jgi:tetratricopeptide (TPR) repeat protein
MKNRIVFLLFGLFSSFAVLGAENNGHYDSLFYEGNTAYKNQKFDSAVFYYSQILNAGYESADLYFNLGNAYFKQNLIPEAILFYEKSIKIHPNNPDVIYNLELCNAQIVDKIKALPTPIFLDWKNGFVHGLSEDGWAFATIAFLIATLIFVLIFLQTNKSIWKRISFYLALVFLLGMGISYFSAQTLNHQISKVENAIIFSIRTNVYAEPNTRSSILFVIHKGLKVNILQKESQWVNISLPDGSTGWIPEEVIQEI